MPKIWELPLKDFIGDYPIVDADLEMEKEFREHVEWSSMAWLPSSLRPLEHDPFVCLADIGDSPQDSALIKIKDGGCSYEVIGGYCDSVLWLDNRYRGHGYGIELILDAATKRNCVMDPVSYTWHGVRAHRAAHEEGVRRAISAGKSIPFTVMVDYPGFQIRRRRTRLDWDAE